MNYLDIIIAIPLIWAAYKGFSKGFIISLASLIALIGGIYGAIHFSGLMSEYLSRWFNPKPEYQNLISFTFTFLLIIAIVYLVGYLLDKVIKATGLGILNRLAGVLFNLFKIALILSVIMNIFTYAGINKPLIPEEHKKESILYGLVSKVAPAVFPYLKLKDLKEKIKEEEPPGIKVITKANIY